MMAMEIFDESRCNSFELVSTRTYDGITSYVFNLNKFSQASSDLLIKHLEEKDKAADINFFYPSTSISN